MAPARHGAAPALGEFLEALETRLRALAADEVTALLVAHAKLLPAGSRQGFLDIFPDPHRQPPTPAMSEDPRLLADIDAFADRVRAGEFDGDEEWDDDFDNDYWDGDGVDASWVDEADALFDAAGVAFVTDRTELAREAYGRLFVLFKPFHLDGSGLETFRLETTDIVEAAARYLRALYETTPPAQRGATLYREYTALDLGGRHLRLRDIASARQGDLPELDVFLPAWIDALQAESAALPAERRLQLLTEAVLLHQGVDGLAGLARRPGPHQSGAYLAWIDALAEAGRAEAAADAAREALALDGAPAAPLAQTADRLAQLTTCLGDMASAVEARCRAWRTQPTRQRLLALVAAGEAAGCLTQTLAAEARHAKARTDRLACELFLLAGEVDRAAAALTHADPLGWSRPDHPGPVVLAYLLVAATAAPPPPSSETQLGTLFDAIDAHGDWLSYDEPDFDAAVGGTAAEAADPPASLAALLARRITENPAPQRQRQQWLAAAQTAVERRVDAIVSRKHRGAYARAASLVVAYAEALLVTDTADGYGYVVDVRQRYPRHSAFRSELDGAVSASSILTRSSAGGSSAASAPRRRMSSRRRS